MRPYVWAQQEPPGEPREAPWTEPGEPTIVPPPAPPAEPPGEPREVPWPEPPGEPEGITQPVAPQSEPPGDPREMPWPDRDRERGGGELGRLRRWAQRRP